MHARRRERVAPLPTRSFVGRDRELEKISSLLLGPARLITLTGAGGIGKTRLAAEAVRRFEQADAGGRRVFWVRLARLATGSDTAAVEEEVAHAVIEADFSGRSAGDALIDTLTRSDPTGRVPRTVLVLDNCEHVLDGGIRVVSRLLDSVPELTVVATSREPLGWVDEYLIAVPPLSDGQALALFQHRAELTEHPVTGTGQTAMAAEICRRIDNHPLYIQLAAARLRHQPLAMILHGLTGHADDTRLRWSRGPDTGADPRHRAVTDVISWSYNLCSDKERLLFERLSVFAAGYATNPDDTDGNVALEVGADLDAIETICADDERTDGEDRATGVDSPSVVLARREIESLLERLVDRSLVSVHMTPTTVRYSLVESLRVFAQDRLRRGVTPGTGESTRLVVRHLRYYHDKIAYVAANWFSPDGQRLLEWTRAAWANILTAIETSIATPGQATVGLEICLGLTAPQSAGVGGVVGEIRRWTQRCLDATRASAPQPTELQIGAMATIALLALLQGCPEDTERMLEDCVAACLPDADTRRNWRHTVETDIGLPAPVEYAWGFELLVVHRDARAIAVFTRARDKFAALGDYGAASRSEGAEAVTAGLLGTEQQAHEITRRYFDRASVSGSPWEKSWAEFALAITLTRHSGNPTEALAFGRASLTYQLTAGDQWAGWLGVEVRTWSLARLIADSLTAGNPDRNTLIAAATEIAHLAGGAETLRTRLGITLEQSAPFAAASGKAVTVARRVLGSDGFAAAETRGILLRPELNEVQRLALGTLTIATRPGRTTASHWHELTSAEQQVAILATAGWTNSAIATRRGKSVRTIDAQMGSILQKLAIASRADIIEHIPKDIVDQVRTETIRRPQRNR
ncbi:AAA family ATPase [Nocardia sp. 2YAB30]|uniref:AAA family ATPase n=1 Tax=unclassified Nocardia TaxID=2637762 RepID=UPI003F94E096